LTFGPKSENVFAGQTHPHEAQKNENGFEIDFKAIVICEDAGME